MVGARLSGLERSCGVAGTRHPGKAHLRLPRRRPALFPAVQRRLAAPRLLHRLRPTRPRLVLRRARAERRRGRRVRAGPGRRACGERLPGRSGGADRARVRPRADRWHDGGPGNPRHRGAAHSEIGPRSPGGARVAPCHGPRIARRLGRDGRGRGERDARHPLGRAPGPGPGLPRAREDPGLAGTRRLGARRLPRGRASVPTGAGPDLVGRHAGERRELPAQAWGT